jgi:hypothetical protein
MRGPMKMKFNTETEHLISKTATFHELTVQVKKTVSFILSVVLLTSKL